MVKYFGNFIQYLSEREREKLRKIVSLVMQIFKYKEITHNWYNKILFNKLFNEFAFNFSI